MDATGSVEFLEDDIRGGLYISAHCTSSGCSNMVDAPAMLKSKQPEAGGGASMDKEQCVPCGECSKEHPPHAYCPNFPCHICYKDHVQPTICPYFFSIPKGAEYNPHYEIVCVCGNEFNEDKWVCTSCPSKQAMLIDKYCSICYSNLHGTYECPEDKVVAAEYKMARDKTRSSVPTFTYYTPKSSSYVPGASSYVPDRFRVFQLLLV